MRQLQAIEAEHAVAVQAAAQAVRHGRVRVVVVLLATGLLATACLCGGVVHVGAVQRCSNIFGNGYILT